MHRPYVCVSTTQHVPERGRAVLRAPRRVSREEFKVQGFEFGFLGLLLQFISSQAKYKQSNLLGGQYADLERMIGRVWEESAALSKEEHQRT